MRLTLSKLGILNFFIGPSLALSEITEAWLCIKIVFLSCQMNMHIHFSHCNIKDLEALL